MRVLTRTALILALSAAIPASAAGPGSAGPLWGFAPTDSTDWRGDTLSIALRADRSATGSFRLENDGSEALGPFSLQLSSDLHSESGGSVPASVLGLDPTVLPLLAAGESADVDIDLNLSAETPPEIYRARLQALLPDFSVYSEFVLELRVRNDENLRVAPNPVYADRRSSVDFRVASEPGMNVDIDLFTMGMDKIRTLHGDGPWSESGVKTLSWNLTNEAGNLVASGMYLALARFEVGDKRFTETRRVMIVH